MQNAESFAVMAKSTDYSVMNYGELLNTKNALSWVAGQIDPILKEKRAKEMVEITHVFVMAMNAFCATKSEILDCLDKEIIWASPINTETLYDVNEQPKLVVTEERKNVESLESPNHSTSILEDVEIGNATDNCGGTAEMIESNESHPDEETLIFDNKGVALNPKESALVKDVIHMAEGLPVGEGTNSNVAYYVSYKFKNAKGELSLIGGPSGWNMSIAGLEKLKMVEPMRVREHYKKVRVVSVDDYMVYLIAGGIVIVSQFYEDNEYVTPHYSVDDLPKEIREAIEESKMIEEAFVEFDREDTSNNDEVEKDGDMGHAINENELIANAVEMIKAMPVGKGVDLNAPYIIECEFSIEDNGELTGGRPFTKNTTKEDLDLGKKRYLKRAETYKASHVSCADNHVAFIYNGGRSMCVCMLNNN